MERELREALDRIHEGGQLQGADVFRFQGDQNFVTAVRFWFKQYRITFLADAEEDKVTVECGLVAIEDEGEWVDVSGQPGWSECIGGEAAWAWCMTNQCGYTDAVRIELELPNDRGSRIVEFVVVASAFRFFMASEF